MKKKQPGFSKWWTYQAERFPVAGHGPLIAVFSLSAVCLSCMLRSGAHPTFPSMIAAFFSSFFFFLQLRIADEFKDFDEDSRYRPYRPVPRGLITLKELLVLGILTGLIQLGLALWLDVALLIPLCVTWFYFAMMSKEFFARRWLKARPVVYMWSHMAIMPLVDLYTTSCDWLPAGRNLPKGLIWFLLVSFFNGFVIEIGRKIRSPKDEEKGVETYSFLWGRKKALLSWGAAMLATVFCAWQSALQVHFEVPVLCMFIVLLAGAVLVSAIFLKNPLKGRGKWIENYAGVWTLCVYFSLGALPFLLKTWGILQ